jgi:hypothetical protein
MAGSAVRPALTHFGVFDAYAPEHRSHTQDCGLEPARLRSSRVRVYRPPRRRDLVVEDLARA